MFASCLGIAHATITVGTCKSEKNPYLTISSAITASPVNGLIQICPGTYPESIVITKPLTLTGLTLAGQQGVTITGPVTGLLPINGSQFFQVYVNNAAGPVNLYNISVLGGPLLIHGQITPIASLAYPSGDIAGIVYQNSAGRIDNVNVSGEWSPAHVVSLISGGSQPDPHQPAFDVLRGNGIGILLLNTPNIEVTVSNSAVIGAGYEGIASTGKLYAFRDIVSVSNPEAIGITTTSGSADFNTVESLIPLIDQNQTWFTTGISGGDSVSGNVVQGFTFGIIGASKVDSNNLINNAIGIIGITGNSVTDNMISSYPTFLDSYLQLGCAANLASCTYPTVGIDLNCSDPSPVKNNRIVSAGFGVVNVTNGSTLPGSNAITGVKTATLSCQ